MINIQDVFEKLQEQNLLFINENGRVSAEMNSVIDILFELNELERTRVFIDDKITKIKRKKEDNSVPSNEKIRKKKGPNKMWTKEEDTFLIKSLKGGMTYEEIAVTLKERTIGAIQQRACHYRKFSHFIQ